MPCLAVWRRKATPMRAHCGWFKDDGARFARCGYPVRVSGYAAMAKIREAHPRWSGMATSFASALTPIPDAMDGLVAEDLVGRSFDDRLVEWWDSLTENLRQTTFFLLDPESWR
jgi:hypothetical protein